MPRSTGGVSNLYPREKRVNMRAHDILDDSNFKSTPTPTSSGELTPIGGAGMMREREVALSRIEGEIVILLRASGDVLDKYYSIRGAEEAGQEGGDTHEEIVQKILRAVGQGEYLKRQLRNLTTPRPLEKNRIEIGIAFLERLIAQGMVIGSLEGKIKFK